MNAIRRVYGGWMVHLPNGEERGPFRTHRNAKRELSSMVDTKAKRRKFMAERDELFRNLTLETATAYWRKRFFPPPVGPDVPLATAHKARLHWLNATDEMLHESRQWLLENGYAVTLKGAEPLTPEIRDAQRIERGMKPLTQESK